MRDVEKRYPGSLGSHRIAEVQCPFCRGRRWRVKYAVDGDKIRRFILVCTKGACGAVAIGEVLRGGKIACYIPIRDPETW